MRAPRLDDDFLDLLAAFLEAGADFVVVGAHALAVHGVVRATGDLDVWVEPTPENAARVYAALRDFGAPLGDLTENDLVTEGVVFQMGLPPRRIDILTRASGLTFAEAWPHCTEGRFGPLACPVIGLDDQIRNKTATGREKDLVDAHDADDEAHAALFAETVTRTTADRFGRIAAALRVKSTPIPTNDLWIAALCVQHDLTLASRDAHFEQLPQIPRW